MSLRQLCVTILYSKAKGWIDFFSYVECSRSKDLSIWFSEKITIIQIIANNCISHNFKPFDHVSNQLLLMDINFKRRSQNLLLKCSNIMADHKISQTCSKMVGQYPITDCYFQYWFRVVDGAVCRGRSAEWELGGSLQNGCQCF